MSDLFPRLRPSVAFVRQTIEGETTYIVKDRSSMQYFRFGEMEAWLMQRMDGVRSLSRLAEEMRQELDIDVAAASLEPFVRKLKELRLVERTPEERRVLLAESLRKERRLKLQGHGNTLLRMRFSLGDPDRLFDRLVGPLSFFWTPWFVAFSVAAFLIYAVIVVSNWSAFTHGLALMYTPSFYTATTIAMIYGSTVVILSIHELGHGLTCKRFGGEVHEIGAMLLYFAPAFFCNVNDAWTFERRSHRLWVTFAGGWIQLLLAVIAAVLWWLTQPGTLVHDIAFFSLLVGGGLSLLVNYNPLIPLDGYYALMDWLEMPNLRPRSMALLSALTKRYALGLDVEVPACTERERRILLIYGGFSVIYTTALLSFFFLFIAHLLLRWLGGWGWVALALVAWMVLRRPARQATSALKARLTARAPDPRRLRRWGIAGLVAVVAVGVSFVTPWTVRVHGAALVEPQERLWLRAPDAGRVSDLWVAEGQKVEAGEPVAVVADPAVELEWREARAAVDGLEHQAQALRSAGRWDAAHAADVRLAAARERLAQAERRRTRLVVTAPFPGRVVTPHLEELLGLGVERGDSIVELWGDGPPRVRLSLDERDAGRVSAGDRVRLRFAAAPSRTWTTRVDAVSAEARDGTVEVLAPLTDAAAATALREGMAGRAKIDVQRTTIAGAVARATRRLIRLDWFL